MQPLDEIERGAGDVGERNLIDEHAHVTEPRDAVALFLGIEIELILKAGASATDDSDAHPLLGAEAFFVAHLTNHLDRFRGKIDVGERGVFLDSLRMRIGVAFVVLMEFFGHCDLG